MKSFRAVLLSTAVVLGFASLARTQGTYTQIDFPGAVETSCGAIDTAGNIVGWYQTDTGVNGFLFSEGTFTTISYPGSPVSELYGINDQGQIVGYNEFEGFGFLYDLPTQTFTEIDFPGSDWTSPKSINNSGTIVGSYQSGDVYSHGFELVGSTYTEILPPGFPNSQDSAANGISDAGEIVGSLPPIGSFKVVGGKYYVLSTGVPHSSVLGINPAGNILVGVNSTRQTEDQHGFFIEGGRLYPLMFPGATNTVPYAVNNVGEIVSMFTYSTQLSHCFTWVPSAR